MANYYKAVFLVALLVAVSLIDAATESENTNADYYKYRHRGGGGHYHHGGRGHYPPSTTHTTDDDGDDTDEYLGNKYGRGGKGKGYGGKEQGHGGKYPPAEATRVPYTTQG